MESPGRWQDPVTVATFDDPIEATYWQGALEAHGIPTRFAATDAWEADACAWMIYNIHLQVPGDLAEHAGALVRARRSASTSEVNRALLTAFVGFGIPPLQLYSLYLVARLLPRWGGLSSGGRRRVALAALFDVWLPFVVITCALCI